MTKPQQQSITLMAVIVLCVTALEITALIKGIDGKAFTLAIGAICLAGGFKLREIFK